ncbi:MAG: hypothetical protein R3F19_13035 [Verrucomicrobiales bacterium]
MRTTFEADMFPSTHWSAISKARGNDNAAAKAALDRLCVTYWKPVYRFIRHLGQTGVAKVCYYVRYQGSFWNSRMACSCLTGRNAVSGDF